MLLRTISVVGVLLVLLGTCVILAAGSPAHAGSGEVTQSQTERVPPKVRFDSNLMLEIETVHGWLKRESPRLRDQLDQFKQTSFIDRRTRRDLEVGLDEALSALTQLRQMLRIEGLSSRQARDMAQVLNEQRDLLDKGLRKWARQAGLKVSEPSRKEAPLEENDRKQLHLMDTLARINRRLHDLGREMVRQAK